MKKKTTMLILVLCSILGLQAQNIVLPYIQEFSGITAGDMNSDAGSNTAVVSPFEGLTVVQGYNAGGVLKLGDASATGSLTTPAFAATVGQKLRVSFYAVAYPSATNMGAKIRLQYGSQVDTINVAPATHSWSLSAADLVKYEVLFDAVASESLSISTISETGLESRVFLDRLKIMEFPLGAALTEGFENVTFPPVGWKSQKVIGTVSWERYTSSTPVGTASASVNYGTSTGNDNWLITPKMLVTAGAHTFKFKAKVSSLYNNTTLYVKVSNTGASIADFNVTKLKLTDKIETPNTLTVDWVEHTIDLSQYVGQGIYVAFNVFDKNGSRVMIDEVSGPNTIPIFCPTPTTFTSQDITANSATIAWTDATASSWIVEHSLYSDFSRDVQTHTVTGAATLNLTGLMPGRNHYVRIKTDCGGGDISGWLYGNFATLCGNVNPFNWRESFDRSNTENKKPDCWTRVVSYSSSSTTTYPNVTTGTTYTQDSEGGGMQLRVNTANPVNLIASPLFENSLNGSEVSFYVKCTLTATDTTTGEVYVGVMSDLTDPTTFIPIESIMPGSANRDKWIKHMVSLESAPTTHKYLAFKMIRSVGTPYVYVDNINVYKKPTCVLPTNFYVADVTDSTAHITWHQPQSVGLSQWIVEYSKDNLFRTNVLSSVATDTTITLTRLQDNTIYYVRVKADCGAEQSFWLEGSLRTTCRELNPLAWQESFVNYTTDNSKPDCWTRIISNGTYPKVSTSSAAKQDELGGGLEMSVSNSSRRNLIVSPAFKNSIANSELTLWAKKSNAYASDLIVGVMIDAADSTTFQPVAIITPAEVGFFEKFYIRFEGISNEYRHIAFSMTNQSTSSTSYYIDNISVHEVPSCVVPGDLQVTTDTITPGTLNVSWSSQNGGQEDAYELAYRLYQTEAYDTVRVTNTTYNIGGLNYGMFYDVKVRALCDTATNDNSDWIANNTGITSCGTVNIPWVYNFYDTDTLAQSGIGCIKILEGWTGSYPRLSTTSNHDPGSINLYLSGVTRQTIALPEFAGDLSGAWVKFWMRRASTSYPSYFLLGVMSDLSDPSTYVALDTVRNVPTSWTEYVIPLSGISNTHKYITFTVVKDGTSGAPDYYLDNILVEAMPACMVPTRVSASNITATGATISWKANSGEQEWKVEYKAVSDTTWTVQTATNDTNLMITGLNPDTKYNVRVMAVCDLSNRSEYSDSHTFTTLCLPVFYVEEDFSSTTAGAYKLPGCWSRNSSTSFPSVVGPETYGNTTNNSVRFSSAKPQFLVAPLIDRPLNQMMLTFDLDKESATYCSDFIVGVMSDPADANTFVAVDTLVNSEIKKWFTHTVFFNSVVDNGSNRYIAFRYGDVGTTTQSTSYYYYVDNVLIDTIPNCMRPTHVSFSRITDTSVVVAWTPNSNEQAWEVEYKSATDTVWTSLSAQTNANLLITGLTSNTQYDVRVKAICDPVNSSKYSKIAKFSTLCTPVASINETFESISTSSLGKLPGCWSKYSSNTNYPSVVDTATLYNVPTKSVKFMSSKPQFLVSPKLNRPLNQLKLDFDLSRESSYCGIIQLGVMSDPMDTTTFVHVADFDNGGVTQTLINHSMLFSNIVDNGSNRFIAFRYGDVGAVTQSISYAYWIDNVVVDTIPNCLAPQFVLVDNIDATWVEIKAVPFDNTATTFDYVITNNIATTAPDVSTAVSVNSQKFTINNLHGNTEYKLWVRTRCEATVHSTWAVPITFRTPCDAVTQSIGYTEHFEGVTPGTGEIPNCWTRVSTHTTFPSVVGPDALYGHTTDNSVRFSTSAPQYLSMQKMNAPLSSLYLKFNLVQESSSCGKIQVGVMSNPLDAATFIPVATINNGNAYKQKIAHGIDFANIVDDTTNRYIAFRYGDVTAGDTTYIQPPSQYYWIDDIEIVAVPSCLGVVDVSASDITASSATVKFVTKPGQTAWQYLIQPNSAVMTPDSTAVGVGITADSVNITGLNANTSYAVWVRAVCGDNDYSSWSDKLIFRTGCGTINLPYFESFADKDAANHNNAYCWTRLVDRSTTATKYPYVSTSSSYSHDAVGGGLYFYLTSSNNLQMVATPEITDLNTAEVSFWVEYDQGYYLNGIGTMEFGVMSDLNDTSTYIPVSDVTPTVADTWVNYEIMLDSVPATHKHIVFKATHQNGSPSFTIDELGIYTIPNCIKPNNVVVDPNTLTATSAEVSWTPRGQENNWIVYHKKSSAAVWDSVVVNNTPVCFLSNLVATSTYEVKVKAVCSTTDMSVETRIVTFRTPCGTEALPFVETFDVVAFPSSECWTKATGKADDVFNGTDLTSTTGGWGRSTTVMPSGAARLNIWGTDVKHWLITPTIGLTGSVENAVLEFSASFNKWNSTEPPTGNCADDKFMVVIGTNNGTTWTQANATVWSNDGLGNHVLNEIPSTPYRYRIDLSQYVGQNIKIAFYGESTVKGNGDNDIHIDSIVVKEVIIIPAQVTTLPAANITNNSATLGKTVVQGTYVIDSEGYRFRRKNSADPRFTTTPDDLLTGLIPGTTYEYYAYVIANGEEYHGETLEFTTTGQAPIPPTVTTLAPTDITQTSAKLHKIVVGNTSEPVTRSGWKYSVLGSNAWFDAPADSTLVGLQPNTTYEFYAYAVTAFNTDGYPGATMTFRTLAHTAPTVVRGNATAITSNSATISKTVTAGSEPIIAQGLKYRVESNSIFSDAPANGQLTALVPNTKYYYFAYATTASFPMVCSDTASFTTLPSGTGLELAESNVAIYPNPAKDEVSIAIDGMTADATATIFDMQGKVVSRHIISAAVGKATIDVSTFTDGTYIVRIVSKDINRVERLIIKR